MCKICQFCLQFCARTRACESSRSFKCQCTCAVSVFGGATPDVRGDRVRGRDRPVLCPGVYWPPGGGSAGRQWRTPGVSTGGGHSYRGGKDTQGRGGLTQHLTGTTHNKAGTGSWAGQQQRCFSLLNLSIVNFPGGLMQLTATLLTPKDNLKLIGGKGEIRSNLIHLKINK